MVRQAEPLRVHQLNNTASVVLELCDAHRTVAEIAEVLAETFGLDALPLAAAAACVAGLRQGRSPGRSSISCRSGTRSGRRSRRLPRPADDFPSGQDVCGAPAAGPALYSTILVIPLSAGISVDLPHASGCPRYRAVTLCS